MVDWMVEVLNNFKCDDQTFFLAVSLIDRFFKNSNSNKQPKDLHLIGLTCMFIASKFEDIYPLKMNLVNEKIAFNKFEIKEIIQQELEILNKIEYKINIPTVLDFLKLYLLQALEIEILGREET